MQQRKKIEKVMLIYPPTGYYMRDDRCQAPVEGMTAQPARAPMDLAYMAAVLEKEGIICIIKDYPAEGSSWEQVRADIEAGGPDMLVFSVTTPTLENDLKVCALAKSIKSGIVVVSKGAHYSEEDVEILNRCPELDVIIRGESEIAIGEIATRLDFSEILGVTYRKNGVIVRNPDRPFLDELDALPFPARHLLHNNLYLTPDTKKPLAYIYVGRGCPYQCIYCAVSVASGYKLKLRSPQKVAQEIEECVQKYNIRDFFFRADTFTFNKEWTVELCSLIIEKKLAIRWGTNSRVDTICRERLEWMKKAGCWIIGFGVESGSQEMLDKMKKRTRIEDAVEAVRLCKEYGIKTYLLFMIGLPWDSRETINETIRFALRLDGDFIDFNIAYPLPGTEFHDIAVKNRLFDENRLHGHDYSKPLVKTFTLSTDELVSLRRKALRRFYLRPRYLFRTLLSINSFTEMINYAKAGIRVLVRVPQTTYAGEE